MKISVDPRDGGTFLIEEVYESIVLRTKEGNEIAICMRDDTFEMKMVGSPDWYRANPETGEIEYEGTPKEKAIEEMGEVLQVILPLGKARRFGLENHHLERPESTNCDELIREVDDFLRALLAFKRKLRMAGFIASKQEN